MHIPLLVWSNFNSLHISEWIILPTQSCVVLHSFFANLLHSLSMWLMVSTLSLHSLHLLLPLLLLLLLKNNIIKRKCEHETYINCYFMLRRSQRLFLITNADEAHTTFKSSQENQCLLFVYTFLRLTPCLTVTLHFVSCRVICRRQISEYLSRAR